MTSVHGCPYLVFHEKYHSNVCLQHKCLNILVLTGTLFKCITRHSISLDEPLGLIGSFVTMTFLINKCGSSSEPALPLSRLTLEVIDQLN